MEMRKNDSTMNADTFHHLLSLARFVVFVLWSAIMSLLSLSGWCHLVTERAHYLLNNGLLQKD